ncbi:hypothetical protein Glove_139g169 [Diversispora epigaea]|uniref:Uncharacterized protein n=1 Tax=Diversispora epigaea TaxID=1348612 RepID=A0A397J534_9GLOM|nr:hypothetical protein Glove_139g169 [Diversispora epigaea]
MDVSKAFKKELDNASTIRLQGETCQKLKNHSILYAIAKIVNHCKNVLIYFIDNFHLSKEEQDKTRSDNYMLPSIILCPLIASSCIFNLFLIRAYYTENVNQIDVFISDNNRINWTPLFHKVVNMHVEPQTVDSFGIINTETELDNRCSL